MQFVANAALKSPTIETGGILIGHHIGSNIAVTRATDAGPNAHASETRFVRDTEYCQQILNQEFATSGADYIGEWHSHVVDIHGPSHGDLETLGGIMLDPDYDFPTFAMVLAIVQKGRFVDTLAYMVEGEAKKARKKVSVRQVVPIIRDCH
jgi:integrative and conjugative element protein (TIGR02256 family)